MMHIHVEMPFEGETMELQHHVRIAENAFEDIGFERLMSYVFASMSRDLIRASHTGSTNEWEPDHA